MSDTCIAEGLIEFLQATAPEWATKLTRERLGTVKMVLNLVHDRDEMLEALKEMERAYRDLSMPGHRAGLAMTRARAAIAKVKP